MKAVVKQSEIDAIEATEREIDIEMDRRMEPSTSKSSSLPSSTSLSSSSSSESNESNIFLNLNGECIEAIFGFLPLDDLCSLSLTCKLAFKLTNQYFYRYYKNHGMEILNKSYGPTITLHDNYVKYFRSNIRNIRLTSNYSNLYALPMFTFLRLNCCENLQELEIDAINLQPTELYGHEILAQLKNLTTISFINCCSTYDIYNGFLRYCHNLKHLNVKNDKLTTINSKFLQKFYPNLVSFGFYVPELIRYHNSLRIFFEKNPHIRNIASHQRIMSYISVSNINLDNLVVQIVHVDYLANIFDDLKSMCEENRIRRLRLEFDYDLQFSQDITDYLVQLEQLTTLDLSFIIVELKLKFYRPITHQILYNVKRLGLEIGRPIDDIVFHVLAVTLPNLEEIYLQPWFKNCIINFRPSIGTFAAKFKKLKSVVIYSIDPAIVPPDAIIEMNYWRKKLSQACPLTIYFPSQIIKKVNFIIPPKSCVHLKPISALQRNVFTINRQIMQF